MKCLSAREGDWKKLSKGDFFATRGRERDPHGPRHESRSYDQIKRREADSPLLKISWEE